jgi:hypothetical protein
VAGSTHAERLDGENGLLLTPSIDHLFDRGFISFEGNGRLLVSPVAHGASLERMGAPLGERVNVGAFSAGQRQNLEFHRARVFLEARVAGRGGGRAVGVGARGIPQRRDCALRRCALPRKRTASELQLPAVTPVAGTFALVCDRNDFHRGLADAVEHNEREPSKRNAAMQSICLPAEGRVLGQQ